MRDVEHPPVVHGNANRLARLYESITRLTEHEPDESFTDAEVRIAGRQLAELITQRLRQARSKPGGGRRGPGPRG